MGSHARSPCAFVPRGPGASAYDPDVELPRIVVAGAAELRGGDGETHPVRGSRKRALLSALVLHRARPVGADVLADAVWGEEPPPTAASALRVHLAELRKAIAAAADDLGGAIATTDAGYQLRCDELDLDVGRFEVLLDRALDEVDDETACALLVEALSQWHAEPYADLLDHEPAAAEIARLRRRRREAAAQLASVSVRTGRTVSLDALAAEHEAAPYDEAIASARVQLLHADGRRGDALEVARDTARRLEAELGVTAGPELAAAEAAVLASGGPSSPRHWSRPRRATQLLGRDADTAAVVDLLRSEALVTLVGPPGIGKTRLAEQVAIEVGGEFDGVVWLDAGTLDTDGDVLALAADVFQLTDHPFRPSIAVLRDRLACVDPLVVVDNAEHVVDGVVELVECAADAGVTVLVTSRTPLARAHERLVAVAPLPADGAGRELLLACVERAGGLGAAIAGPRWAEQVCEAVEGIPLAIELAARTIAAHGHDLPVSSLVRRLGSGDGTRDDSLRAAVELSLTLLPDDDVALFASCGTFAAWFTAEDAAALVDADPEAGLVRLAEHSLIVTGGGARGPRFRLLHPLREVARRRLSADPERERLARAHHAHRIAREAGRAGRDLMGLEPTSGWTRLAELTAELELALDWFEEGHDPDAHVQLAADLWLHWYLSGRAVVGRRRTVAALETGAGTPNARGDALAAASFLSWMQGDYPAVRRWVTEARDLGASGTALPVVELANATLAWIDHRLDETEHHLAMGMRVLDERRAGGLERAFVGAMWANVTWFLGRPAEAAALYRDAALAAERVGHGPSAGLARRHEVLCLALAGDPTAPARVELLLGGADAETDPLTRCQISTLGGLALLELGAPERATTLLRAGVEDAARLVDALSLLLGTIGLVRLAHRAGHADGVAAGLGWLDTALGLTGVPLPEADRVHLDEAGAWLQEMADETLLRRRVEAAALPAAELASTVAPPG